MVARVLDQRDRLLADRARHRVVPAAADAERHRVEIDGAVAMEAKPRLGFEDAARRLFHARPRNLSSRDRGDDRGSRRGRIRRVENHIDAGLDGAHRGLARARHPGNRRHLHRVGDDQAVEARTQQRVQHRVAERGRLLVGIDRRQLDVRHHHGGGAGLDARPERRQLDRVETLARMRDDRQPEVRVDVGIAMAREVLKRGEHAAFLQPAHPAGDHLAGLGGILAEGADVDHGIARVVVDVGDRRKVDVHAQGARFGRDDLAGFIGQLRIAGGAKRHRPRELGGAGNPHLHAPLEVGRGQQRHARDRLQAVVDRGQRQRLAQDGRAVGAVEHHLRRGLGAAERNHPADVGLVNQLHERLVFVGVAAQVRRVEGREHQLPDQLLDRHLLERRVHPLPRRLVERLLRGSRRNETGKDDGNSGTAHARTS
jgi:hypothetical protein